ncbi:MAG: hypothetical protein L3J57_14245 [Desulfuromusa sp.]|nr:hypothetical protein [Desulfuromusa sp.]
MAAITLEQAEAQRDKYLKMSLDYDCQAYVSTRAGQRNSKDMPTLGEINKQIKFWEQQVARLEGRSRINAGAPL